MHAKPAEITKEKIEMKMISNKLVMITKDREQKAYIWMVDAYKDNSQALEHSNN